MRFHARGSHVHAAITCTCNATRLNQNPNPNTTPPSAVGTTRHISTSRPHAFFWGSGSDKGGTSGAGSGAGSLLPGDVATAWLDDAGLVDPDLGVLKRSELWLNLRMCNGLDLPAFLDGAKAVYPIVSGAMLASDWRALGPLVVPQCLEAMREAMEDIENQEQRIVLSRDRTDDFAVESAVLTRVSVMEDAGADATGTSTSLDSPHVPCARTRTVHLHVKFSATETYKIEDCFSNQAMPPFDGSPRHQESTWVFEGDLRAPLLPAPVVSADQGADQSHALRDVTEEEAGEHDAHDEGWRVVAFV